MIIALHRFFKRGFADPPVIAPPVVLPPPTEPPVVDPPPPNTAPLTIAAYPASVTHSVDSAPGGLVVLSGSTTVQALGGNSVYTYAWTCFDTGGWSLFSNTGGLTSVTLSLFINTLALTYRQQVWRCTVTDGLGATASVDVLFTFDRYDSTPYDPGLNNPEER